MFMNRRNILVAGAAILGTALTSRRASAAAQTTLKISTPNSSYKKMLDELAAKFSAANPNVGVEFIGKGDNWDPLLQFTFREGLIGDLPDGTWQSLTYASLLAQRGYAQPLNAVAGGAGAFLELGLSNTLIESVSTASDVYAMPFGTTIPVIYYNIDLLRRAGYSAANPPATWEEIFDFGSKISLDKKLTGGFIEYEATNAWIFQNLLATFGGRMMSADLKAVAFDSPAGLEALNVLWRFGDISSTDMTRDQARQAFNAGTSGIHVRSASGTTSVAKAATGQFELRVGQLPLSGSAGRMVGAGHGFMMFTKDEARQKAMWDFMRFAAGPEGQMILAKNTGYMPINTLALKQPAFLKGYLEINPYHKAIVESLAITSDQFSFPSDNTVKIADMMAEDMRQVAVHETKPENALAHMVEQTKKLLG
ncbi:extracellular solute-binding protein [Mesorhizobium sp. M0859]|uniref:extracellular solute-binding protein n=1 Tax=Mesorhizobium sp. M0859 TaxID=2957014 RepID=UPI00333BCB41